MTRAALRSGRVPDDITLVAVSKTYPADAIRVAVDAGADNIGESRVQEAEAKLAGLGTIARWHLIGHLQTNKVKKAVALFDMIQAVDSLHLAEAIDRRASETGQKIDCLLEVNSSGEEQKFGVGPDEAEDISGNILELKNIQLRGLMTVGPFSDDEKGIREAFQTTRNLFEKIKTHADDSFAVLSMGMSADFEWAIEEGSNMIRVGTAIFGRRNMY